MNCPKPKRFSMIRNVVAVLRGRNLLHEVAVLDWKLGDSDYQIERCQKSHTKLECLRDDLTTRAEAAERDLRYLKAYPWQAMRENK